MQAKQRVPGRSYLYVPTAWRLGGLDSSTHKLNTNVDYCLLQGDVGVDVGAGRLTVMGGRPGLDSIAVD